MNKDSNRFIGDILEINSDIINQRIESKSPKFITNIKEKIYRRKLDKIIKNIKKQKLILNKFNIQELLYYLYTYNKRYNIIQSIKVSNISDYNIITSELLIEPESSFKDIKYVIDVSSREKNMTIFIIMHSENGTVITNTIRVDSLYYNNDSETNINFALKTLNNSLLDILEKFLLEYLERFKYNKGYLKNNE